MSLSIRAALKKKKEQKQKREHQIHTRSTLTSHGKLQKEEDDDATLNPRSAQNNCLYKCA
jgi:hypothetical protein